LSDPIQPADSTPPRKKRWKRWLLFFVLALVGLLVAGELVARFYLQLGEPPLSMFDADMEYRFQPWQTCHRFGHLIHYNAYSQRADDYPPHKSSPDELRVMVIGDSVVNGGAPTDQSEVCTSVLQQMLRREFDHRTIYVGNASAASWGPPNELAYVQKFGLFDADVVVLVFNSEDAGDAPTFAPVIGSSDFPDHRPISALWEGIAHYGPGQLARFHLDFFSGSPGPASSLPGEVGIPMCISAIQDMVKIGRESGAKVIIGQQMEQIDQAPVEERDFLPAAHDLIQWAARQSGVEPVEWHDQFVASMRAGQMPYRDYIHPNAVGSRIIAEALFPAVREALLQATTRPTTRGS
jgi:lysophospholipase L1-like esterase